MHYNINKEPKKMNKLVRNSDNSKKENGYKNYWYQLKTLINTAKNTYYKEAFNNSKTKH